MREREKLFDFDTIQYYKRLLEQFASAFLGIISLFSPKEDQKEHP